LAEKKFDLATCMGLAKSFKLDMGKGFSIGVIIKIEIYDPLKTSLV